MAIFRNPLPPYTAIPVIVISRSTDSDNGKEVYSSIMSGLVMEDAAKRRHVEPNWARLRQPSVEDTKMNMLRQGNIDNDDMKNRLSYCY